MPTFEEFEQSLRDVLVHFRDPAYQPPDLLRAVLGHKPQPGAETFQQIITHSIESLRPATTETSTGQRSRRFYELLTCRYLQELTQEETAERLGITPRHVRREQQQAIHALARLLWEKSLGLVPTVADNEPEGEPRPDAGAWRSQVREELAALQHSAPGSVVEVATAIAGVLKIGRALTAQHNISLQVETIEPDLTVAMHPSALRQVLITGIEKLGQSIGPGRITLAVQRSGERVHLLLSGEPAVTEQPPDSDLMREILAVHSGEIAAFLEGERVGFRLDLPTVDKVIVLVIDDNMDLVHFYRRYTTGTRYQIVHLAEGQHALETVREIKPAVIVLDVMLPDIDGWELLTDLRGQPASQMTPIIVCSVVRRAELAVSLGASLYLPKPVRRREFVEALDQILNPAPAAG